jgi:hypothetical protein
MSNAASTTSARRGLGAVPVYVWILAVLGGVAGALLADSGDFWGNTVPSLLSFVVAGAVLGLVVWAVQVAARRR